jgi:hypothetical protein
MSADFSPGAYIRVRVPGGPRPDGSILVYFPNGTGLVVPVSQLCAERPGPLTWPAAGPTWTGRLGLR